MKTIKTFDCSYGGDEYRVTGNTKKVNIQIKKLSNKQFKTVFTVSIALWEKYKMNNLDLMNIVDLVEEFLFDSSEDGLGVNHIEEHIESLLVKTKLYERYVESTKEFNERTQKLVSELMIKKGKEGNNETQTKQTNIFNQ